MPAALTLDATRRAQAWMRLDPQHAAAIVRILAAARTLFVALGLLAVCVDPPVPDVTTFTVVWLGLVLLLSVGVLVATHRVPLVVVRRAAWLHAFDFAWIVAIVAATGSANSPFIACFVFVIISAAYQWGWRATLATGAVAVVVVLVGAAAHAQWNLGEHVHFHTALLRVASLGIGACLVGWLTQKERVQRARSVTVSRIVSGTGPDAGVVASVRSMLEAVLDECGAQHASLLLQEGPHVFLWAATRAEGDRVELTLTEIAPTESPYLFPVPPEVGALRVRREGTDLRVLALDGSGAALPRGSVCAAPLLLLPFPWTTLFCLIGVSGHGWTGRLFVVEPATRFNARAQLRFLQAVVRQVAPALLNVYLQRRIASRAGGEERRDLARAVHDGSLQSLITAGLELELLRRDLGADLSARGLERIARVQAIVADQVLETRDLLQSVKHRDLDPERFFEHLENIVSRFRDSTGMDVRLLCDAATVECGPRTCRELADVLREALVNVRKHAQARSVRIRLSAAGDTYRIVVVDDGRGFDFEGRLNDEELDRQRLGPLSIRERLKGIGAGLVVESRPGQGSTLEITVPRRAS
jgi:signal transduction histidine kinase